MVYTENSYFEWDEQKNAINIKKHGVNFIDVLLAFSDPNCLIHPDSRHSQSENRFHLVGKVNIGIVLVVFANRGINCRIISARKATKKEKEFYGKKTNS